VFDTKNGTVSAGNASGITDGAAALLVMRAERAEALGYEPLAEVGETVQVGLDPTVMGLGPVPACQALQRKNGLAPLDYDLIELNEAFAAQCVAVNALWKSDAARVNVHGGAIALGHPIGASGARILSTLIWALEQRGGKHGLATLCLGGGGAVAVSVEML